MIQAASVAQSVYGCEQIRRANACGLPVAAFPVTGPVDVVIEGRNGALDEDLRAAALKALDIDRQCCIDHARTKTWARCAEMVLDNLACDEPVLELERV